MQLTTNFPLNEFKVSSSYPEIAEEMEFTENEIDILILLCESIAQPVRDRYGMYRPLSGKRSIELNALVGGSPESDHISCNAFDFTIYGVDMFEVFKWIYDTKLHYRQLIYYPKKNIIHASNNIPGKYYKNEALICDDLEKKKFRKWGTL